MIEAIERNPVVGNRLMGEFLGKAQERWSKADGIGAACDVVIRDYGEAALFLFVRSHPHFVVDRDHENVAHSIVAATKLRDALGAPQKAPGIKKLYLHWLGVERELLIANFGFSIAEAENLKEALPLAMKIVTDTNNPTGYRAELMIKCVAKFGGREQLKDLAPFLEDDELLGSSQRNSEPQLFMQFRDIALAVSVKLAGEKLADFGMLDDHQYGFPDDAARKAAFTKWKAWTEKHAKTAKK
jgi:hypothetical protein